MNRSIFAMVFGAAILLNGCNHSIKPNNSVSKAGAASDMSSQIKMVNDSEPGRAIVIRGTIYMPDGKTPAQGAILSVWQTDANGNYVAEGGGAGELHPRIHGRVKTGADGEYEFHTIEPAPYPSHTVPAHIHVHLSAPDFPEYSPDSYYFDGDALIPDRFRAEFGNVRIGASPIVKLVQKSDGIFYGHRDFILKYVKPSGETLKLEW